jgi:hypothetical protein
MKAVGGIFLILSALLLSFYLEQGERRRIRELTALLDFLLHAAAEIGTYGRPMAEIIANYENNTLQELGFFAAAHGGDLAAGVRAVMSHGSLTSAELSPLFSLLSSGLPPTPREAAAALSLVAGELAATRDFYKSSAPRTVRVFRAVAGAGTAIAVLLLL